jgi:hypothetical protein
MRILAFILGAALSCSATLAQEHANSAKGPKTRAVTLVSGLGNLHHPDSTKNPQAQKFFDQGLRFICAFNHDEAARSFQHAGELDPQLAMAFWGVAALWGLHQALLQQHRDYDAGFIKSQFDASWKGQPSSLKLDVLV